YFRHLGAFAVVAAPVAVDVDPGTVPALGWVAHVPRPVCAAVATLGAWPVGDRTAAELATRCVEQERCRHVVQHRPELFRLFVQLLAATVLAPRCDRPAG